MKKQIIDELTPRQTEVVSYIKSQGFMSSKNINGHTFFCLQSKGVVEQNAGNNIYLTPWGKSLANLKGL